MPDPSARRSQAWYGGDDRDAFIHRAWMRRGIPGDAFDGRAHVAICTTWSDLSPCNRHLQEVGEHVARGVWEAGGIPLEMPVPSLGETQMRPTTMLYRNLAAMTIEELIRANPIDGVVLLGGCDKTIPALLMGACSVDLPSLVVAGGPMLTGTWRGEPLGCGTDVWRLSEELRAGTLSAEDFRSAEASMIRSRGHCNTMGTASTMACMAEALGTTLPGNAGLPAPDSRLLELSHAAGKRIVEMIDEDLRPSALLDRGSFLNALATLSAIGGSTNAVLHLLAIAGRVGARLSLEDVDAFHGVPLLVDLQPAGRHLMEDFHRAGGLRAVLREIRGHLDAGAITVTGRPLVEHLETAERYDAEVIRSIDDPLLPAAGIAVLRGNLAPDGAIIKPAAASQELLRHRGRAIVFESPEELRARLDDPDLEIDESSVMVLRGCGPRGYPGMPEVGNMPLPKKLLDAGVRDLVRISDARMSGTAYGTVVLHVAPEAAAGGPLSLVRDGDPIALDVEDRTLRLEIEDGELSRRRRPDTLRAANPASGWERLYVDHVTQADTGADLDFLVGCRGSAVPRESH
jgi:dihydroxy-acid dehydratase